LAAFIRPMTHGIKIPRKIKVVAKKGHEAEFSRLERLLLYLPLIEFNPGGF
jgi:hypothetical protein